MSQYQMLHQVCQWHQEILNRLEAMQNNDFEIVLHSQNGERFEVEFSEEKRKGFDMALALVEHMISTFPVKYELSEDDGEEEE